jgi:hypothetical protein
VGVLNDCVWNVELVIQWVGLEECVYGYSCVMRCSMAFYWSSWIEQEIVASSVCLGVVARITWYAICTPAIFCV